MGGRWGVVVSWSDAAAASQRIRRRKLLADARHGAGTVEGVPAARRRARAVRRRGRGRARRRRAHCLQGAAALDVKSSLAGCCDLQPAHPYEALSPYFQIAHSRHTRGMWREQQRRFSGGGWRRIQAIEFLWASQFPGENGDHSQRVIDWREFMSQLAHFAHSNRAPTPICVQGQCIACIGACVKSCLPLAVVLLLCVALAPASDAGDIPISRTSIVCAERRWCSSQTTA